MKWCWFSTAMDLALKHDCDISPHPCKIDKKTSLPSQPRITSPSRIYQQPPGASRTPADTNLPFSPLTHTHTAPLNIHSLCLTHAPLHLYTESHIYTITFWHPHSHTNISPQPPLAHHSSPTHQFSALLSHSHQISFVFSHQIHQLSSVSFPSPRCNEFPFPAQAIILRSFFPTAAAISAPLPQLG